MSCEEGEGFGHADGAGAAGGAEEGAGVGEEGGEVGGGEVRVEEGFVAEEEEVEEGPVVGFLGER